MADTINISDKVVMAQARTKTSQRLLTYVTQTPGPTPTISGVLRELNELIFAPRKIRGEKEKFPNNAKGPLECPSLRMGDGYPPKKKIVE